MYKYSNKIMYITRSLNVYQLWHALGKSSVFESTKVSTRVYSDKKAVLAKELAAAATPAQTLHSNISSTVPIATAGGVTQDP